MSALKRGKTVGEIREVELQEEEQVLERTRFKKLDNGDKAMFKEILAYNVEDYWNSHKQIPFSETYSELKNSVIQTFNDESVIMLKDDAELKSYIQTQIIVTINRLLKAGQTL